MKMVREDGFSSPGKSLDESMTDFALSKYLDILWKAASGFNHSQR